MFSPCTSTRAGMTRPGPAPQAAGLAAPPEPAGRYVTGTQTQDRDLLLISRRTSTEDNGTGPMNHGLDVEEALAVVSTSVASYWGLRLGAPGALGRVRPDRLRHPRGGRRRADHALPREPALVDNPLAGGGPPSPWFSSRTPHRVNVGALRTDAALPARLLGIGLPLTIGAGAGAAALLLRRQRAVGGGRHRRHRRPDRRRARGIHHGGRAGALGGSPPAQRGERPQRRHRHAVRQPFHRRRGQRRAVAGPPGRGALDSSAGRLSALLWRCRRDAPGVARRHRWSSPGFRPIAVLALALFAYSASVVAGTNGFIAAFVAGMAFGTVDHQDDEVDLRFTEEAARSFRSSSGSCLAPSCSARASPTWLARRGVCTAGADRPAHGARRPRAGGKRPRPRHRWLRRLVRAPRPGLGGVRPHRGRLAGAGPVQGGTGRGHP